MEVSQFVFLCIFYAHSVMLVSASLDDCWDPEKLAKMRFNSGRDDQHDPNLSQFTRLLKCIQKQQGQTDDNFGQMDFQQWENVARNGQFPPGWNYPNGQPPPNWGRPGDRQDNYGRDGRRPPPPQYPPQQYPPQQYPPQQYPPNQTPPTGQPRPGVHPDDWNSARDPGNPDLRWSTPGYGDEDRDYDRSNRKDRKKNRNQRKKDRLLDDNYMGAGPSIPPEFDDRKGPWNDNTDENLYQQQQPIPGAPVGRDFMMIDDEETSLHRKYGYAIMALSVVVLAVLMVSTIFCCNSSNSTMNQPVAQAAPISQIDNYSIYSYKQGAIPADTYHSMGTMRTETLQSTHSHASPQYRVSDINTDTVRRYHEANPQHY